MKLKVLFVDDEERLLDGLRRALRPMRGQWEMRFAKSGPEALAVMEEDPADVIVADMRMPGMDGAELLCRVRDRWPQAIRVILSGHSDNKADVKATRPAHQYLSKPCDTECLRNTISRAFSLRRLLSSEELRASITRMESLPSLPSIYEELTRELASEDPSMNRVGEIVCSDLGLTTKILQLVNSAFFGIPRRISNPMEAVMMLGLENLQVLVLSAGVFQQLQAEEMPEGLAERLWIHSVRTGFLAKEIARSEGLDPFQVDDAFLAGMIHDVGKVILACNFPKGYREVLEHVPWRGEALTRAERGAFGASHAEVGAYLMGLWGMPDTVVEALAFHHRPQEAPSQGLEPVGVVSVANFLDDAVTSLKEDASAKEKLEEYLSRMDLKDKMEHWGGFLEEGGMRR